MGRRISQEQEREERELAVELDFLSEGIDRAREAQARGAMADTTAGCKMLRETIKKLARAIEAEQNAIERGVRRPHGVALVALDAEKLAYITLRTIINAFAENDAKVPVTRLARHIGQCCWLERAHDTLRGRAKDALESLVRRNKNPWNARKRAEEKFAVLKGRDWGDGDLGLRLGALLLKLAVDHSTLIEKHSKVKEPDWVELTEGAQGRLRELLEEQEWLATPLRLPMVEQPRPWRGATGGGYFMVMGLPLVKRQDETNGKLEADEVEIVCGAVNSIQETPWRINRRMLEVLRKAWERKDPSLPSVEFRKLPPELNAGSATEEERSARGRERARGYAANRAAAAHAIEMRRRFRIADRFEREPELFFPHQLDHRGRAYPLPQVIHPQGDDIGRALIEFARGKPVGENGGKWLAVHLANTFGLSKLSYAERIAWANEHRDAILDSAARPLEGGRFWTTADKPWRFLAAAFEWVDFSKDGSRAISRIPVAMDGTCNGLQHMSALGRDSQGGQWTNLLPSDRPKDIYQAVADRLAARIAEAASAGDPMARAWHGLIDRKLVKPATMTTPYGVTDDGIANQLLATVWERFPGRFEKEGTAVAYLSRNLKESIAGAVVKAVEIADWLRAVADVLALKGRGFQWRVPTGFPVIHHYLAKKERRIRTAMGTLLLQEPDPTPGKLDLDKQIDAIVPNLVHSLDAAHMILTVEALQSRGLADFAMVHDGYAVHACDVDVMNEVLRNQFIRVHREFTLEAFRAQIAKQADGIEIPPPPVMGALDLDEVRRADYFFS
ncbi:MAG: hypothetical protein HYY17_01790 [Planctomycetes bacterium]|nr:hypothetical protein [Planctomycetota bacterium]